MSMHGCARVLYIGAVSCVYNIQVSHVCAAALQYVYMHAFRCTSSVLLFLVRSSATGGMACAVSVSRVVHIKGGRCIKPWTPRTLRTVDGVEFVTLDPKDTGFSMCVFGSSRWQPCTFLDELMQQRGEESKAAGSGAPCNLFAADSGSVSDWRKKAERRKVKGALTSVGVQTVTLQLPAWEGTDGATLEPLQLLMMVSLHRKEKVEVELQPQVIHYIAERCRASVMATTKRRAFAATPGRGVYWHKQKHGFVAKAEVESTLQKFKTVKVPRRATGAELEAALCDAASEAVQFTQPGGGLQP